MHFTPHLRPMVWGGHRLGQVLHKPLPTKEPYGESWEVSDHPLHRSALAEGPWAGVSLRQLMEQESSALLGPAAARHSVFPWLVKFLDANDWLSVQVHPDERAVRTLWPGEGSKTEAWYIVAAAPESRIYAGLLPGVTEGDLRAALAAGTVADCLHSFLPRAGDCVFLPAGTVHAVGGGVLIAEVQQTSDATFRLFDWNRRDSQGKTRKLHIEEALASIHWGQGPVQPVRAAAHLSEPCQRLVSCPYFSLDHIRITEASRCGGSDTLQVIIVLEGEGQLVTPTGSENLTVGQTWVLPASMPSTWCRPQGSMSALLATLPN
jgi:mannose-6-phosphate isomerase